MSTEVIRPQETGDDERYKALRKGVAQLNSECLARLNSHLDLGEPLVLDRVHHERTTNTWCPLAVALDVPRVVGLKQHWEQQEDGEHETEVLAEIQRVGAQVLGQFDLNPISGVPGNFYRDDRYSDLRRVVVDEIDSRQGTVTAPIDV